MWLLLGFLTGIFHGKRPHEGLYGAVARTGRVVCVLLIGVFIYGLGAVLHSDYVEVPREERQGAEYQACLKTQEKPVPVYYEGGPTTYVDDDGHRACHHLHPYASHVPYN